MALPLDLRDMLSSGAKLRAEREKPVRIAVFVDATAPDVLVEALKEALHPQTGHALLHVEAVVPGDVLAVDSSADVVIGIAGDGATLEPSLRRAREQAIPVVVAALGHDRDAVSRLLQHPLLDTVVEEELEELVEALGRWLGDRVTGKRISLAANFAFVRRAVAEDAVKSTSFQNAVIGGVAFIPGADMPLMTANQAKMVMQIAAAYGEPLGAERIKELAAVIGGAFALRTVARQLVGLLPGFGWALKAGIGYSGTLAMGYAAIEYFESGGDVGGLAQKVREARDKAMEAARTRRLPGRGKAEVIEATWTEAASEGAVDAAGPGGERALPEATAEFELPAAGSQPQ